MTKIIQALQFLKGRLTERSTWLFWGASVGSVALLPAPWSYIAFGFSLVAGMIPDVK